MAWAISGAQCLMEWLPYWCSWRAGTLQIALGIDRSAALMSRPCAGSHEKEVFLDGNPHEVWLLLVGVRMVFSKSDSLDAARLLVSCP